MVPHLPRLLSAVVISALVVTACAAPPRADAPVRSSAVSQGSSSALPAGAPPSVARSSAASSSSASAAPAATLRPTWSGGVYRNEVIALMYHAFRPNPTSGDVISPQNFAEQLALFQKEGYHPITLQQFENFVSRRAMVPPNALLLTFDNGYESFYQQAYPLLVRYRYPAVLFAIGSWLSGQAPAGIHPISWAQAKQMVASGLVTVQGQTWNMHSGVMVSPTRSEAADIGLAFNLATHQQETMQQYDQAVTADLQRAQSALKLEIGQTASAFAYPFGDYDPALISLLHATGYQYLFAAKLGWGNLQGQSPNVLYRVNTGAYHVTPEGAISAIHLVARDTANDPGWQPPRQYIEVW